MTKVRAIAYVDGFNLYYGLKNASRNADFDMIRFRGDSANCLGKSLYWLDIQRLVLGQIRKSEECIEINYFSAPRRIPRLVSVNPAPFIESNERQETYLAAIKTLPLVQVRLGWYAEKNPHRCLRCCHSSPNFEEKGTDVNIAVRMMRDAFKNRMDLAIVLSADGDLASPIEAVREMGKEVLVLLAPGRRRADKLREVASRTNNLKIKSARNYILPAKIERPGLKPIERPPEWAAPGRWIWTDDAPSPSEDSN